MKSFNIKNLGEYHHLYVQSDATQLVDIFEKFKTLCLKEYELDPAYFCTTPGPAFEACLKNTKAKLELITDIDMELMIEKGIRGGISQPMQRYASAKISICQITIQKYYLHFYCILMQIICMDMQ